MEWENLGNICAPLMADPDFKLMAERVQEMPDVVVLLKELWTTNAVLRLSASMLLKALVARADERIFSPPSIRTTETDASFEELLAQHESWPDTQSTRALHKMCTDSVIREGMRGVYYRSPAAQALAVMSARMLQKM